MEFRLVHQCVMGKSDFVEGVRALLIDKTGKPQWDPTSIEQVGIDPDSSTITHSCWHGICAAVLQLLEVFLGVSLASKRIT